MSVLSQAELIGRGNGEMRNAHRILVGKLMGRGILEDLGADRRVILEMLNRNGMVFTGFIWSG
jgi:hypothetical protein